MTPVSSLQPRRGLQIATRLYATALVALVALVGVGAHAASAQPAASPLPAAGPGAPPAAPAAIPSAVSTGTATGTAVIAPVAPLPDRRGQRPGNARPAELAVADLVTLNFSNADIEGVLKAVSEITGRNFLVDPRVKGTVNIVSARPVPRAQVYDLLLSALRMQGFATIDDRNLVRVVPEADARLLSTRTVDAGERARDPGDAIVTRVFSLSHEAAAQLLPVLRPLISPNNAIAALPGSNALVVTDYASNMQRVERIIERVDRPAGGSDPVVIPLRHVSAVDLAQTITRLFSEPAAAADPLQRLVVVPDVRSNTLLVRSGDPARLTRVRNVVASLDAPGRAGGNAHVVYLRNADAVRVAETLRAIYATESPGAPRRAGALADAGLPQATPAGPPGGSGTSPMPAPRPATAPPAAGGGADGVSIQADPATNSVLIVAPDPVYNDLRAILDKLDLRRAQVYVEALIAEVTASRAAEFGVQWQDLGNVGSSAGEARGFGGTNFGGAGQNIVGIARNAASVGRGLNVGVLHGQVSIPGLAGPVLSINALVRALETDANANILSTPTLLTLDNEEARIVIGQNVPFITGQYALSGAAATPTPFQTIERRDVGLTLRIRPQISAGGAVRLQLYQEVSSVQDATNAAGVITNKRAVESNVVVDDGRIVVIGGLIQDTLTDSVERVPLLGELPVIGSLFRYTSRSRVKTNLMVFLRPTLVRDERGAEALSGERYEYILGEQRAAQPPSRPLLPDMTGPQLPPRKPAP